MKPGDCVLCVRGEFNGLAGVVEHVASFESGESLVLVKWDDGGFNIVTGASVVSVTTELPALSSLSDAEVVAAGRSSARSEP